MALYEAARPQFERLKGIKSQGLLNTGAKHHRQRASLRMTLARNKGDGKSGAHGRHISREAGVTMGSCLQ